MPWHARARWLFAATFALLSFATVQAENWPGWRGPRDDGTSAEKDVPIKWSATENVLWKTPLPAPGNSTPIVWDDRIFVTQANKDGTERGLLCFDRIKGEKLWEKYIPFEQKEQTHGDNDHAAASPVTDGQTVYAWLGSAGVFAWSVEGEEKWRRDLGTFTHIWGFASSPIIYQDLLILNCGPGQRAFVTALNRKTGETVWQIEGITGKAQQFVGTWSSPRIVQHEGQELLLISHPHDLVAYTPRDGKEVWRCNGLYDLVYTSPIVSEGVAVAMSGYHGRALAVKMGGTGDITEKQRLWLSPEQRGEPQRIGSGIIVDGSIYMVEEPGMAQKIDLISGKKLWEKTRLGTSTWSSLVFADGRFYNVDRKGTTYVFAPGETFELLAENRLNERTQASVVVSHGHIFIRTYNNLWCIGK